MLRTFPRRSIVAVAGIALLFLQGAIVRAQAPELSVEPPSTHSASTDPKSTSESLLIFDGEELPESAVDGRSRENPSPRWLDDNYQLAYEGDPWPPGANPLLERAGLPVGWFAGIELTAVKPHLLSQIDSGDSLQPTFPSSIQLPVANIDWSVMPRFQVGYRRENGLGEFSVSYRFVLSSGNGSIANFDAAGAGRLDTNLNVQVLDLDYGFTDYNEELPWWVPFVVTRSLGVRVAGVVSESNAYGQQILSEQAKNTFVGAGPRTRFDMLWPLSAGPVPRPVSFFGGFDLSGVVGPSNQRFYEQSVSGGSLLTATGRTGGNTTGVATLGLQAGLSWVPEWRQNAARFSAGFQWERWWFLGGDNGNVELTLQGPFVRGELRF
ncbi:MAG TPA: Lpg1974 family pore-forming outer membrane protein [Planctomycetaceae bacterium]|nr:Lpg1974 family pore-forming outer membrane protein [Planctomycetaceae bacterium]